VFPGDEVSQKKVKASKKYILCQKRTSEYEYEKSKIDIKLKKNERPSTTISPFYFL
jgi:hypothetical protein